VQPAAARRLLHLDARRKADRELLHVRDRADHASVAAELLDRVDDDLERLRIEGAESLVEEEGVDARLLRDGERPHLLGKRERQRERREERLPSRERADAPSLLAVPRVDDEELVALEREPVAAGG